MTKIFTFEDFPDDLVLKAILMAICEKNGALSIKFSRVVNLCIAMAKGETVIEIKLDVYPSEEFAEIKAVITNK